MATTNTNNKHDDYWKIQEHEGLTAKQMKAELDRRNYIVTSTASKAGYREHLRRSDKGCISFDQFTNDELRQLIHARDIRHQGKCDSRRTLIRILKQADDNPKFHRFRSLPPEIRNTIYEMYNAEFTEPIYAPTQPPLTKVCRLIRRESLQMFYNTCTFKIAFDLALTDSRASAQLQVSNRLLLWFYSTQPANLRLIRRFEVCVHAPKPYTTFLPAELVSQLPYNAHALMQLSSFRITLPKTGFAPARLSGGVFDKVEVEAGLLRRTVRLKRRVRSVIVNAGRRNLQHGWLCVRPDAQDVLNLRAAMESAFA